MAKKARVYLETSIVSYLTARPSKNLIAAAWQQITSDWWRLQRKKFDLYISELVLTEASKGDSEAAQRRYESLNGIPELTMNGSVQDLAEIFLNKSPLPSKATVDALHIAIAAVHQMDYLLTWNCRHIDNAEIKPIIRNLCLVYGYQYPEICTPHELMGENNDQ